LNRAWFIVSASLVTLTAVIIFGGSIGGFPPPTNHLQQDPITPSVPLPTVTPTSVPAQPLIPDESDARAASCAAFGLPNFFPYVVQTGDTLRGLIGGYDGLSITQLAALNCLDDPDALPVGAVIWLPVDPLAPDVTAEPTVCDYEWLVEVSTLGCAPAPAEPIFGAFQLFEGGVMIWFSDTQEIFVLIEGEESPFRAAFFEDTYREGEVTSDSTPPQGLFVPVRGFAKVWAFLGAEDGALGWAIEEERGVDLLRQPAGRTSYTTYITIVQGAPDAPLDEIAPVYAVSAFPGLAEGYWVIVGA
jgi:hypothetical protein